MKKFAQYILFALLTAFTAACQDNENWRIIPYEPETPDEPGILYVVGNHQGWDPAAEVIGKIYSVENNGIYSGYVYLNGEFKCTTEQSWDGTNYGKGDDESLSTDKEAGNLTAEEGYYLLTVDTKALSYSLKSSSWGVIGDATPDGWNSDTDLVYDPTDLKLKADITLTDGEIKFRENDAWDVDLGGSLEKLELKGGNIKVTAGNYQIILDLSTPNYAAELISK